MGWLTGLFVRRWHCHALGVEALPCIHIYRDAYRCTTRRVCGAVGVCNAARALVLPDAHQEHGLAVFGALLACLASLVSSRQKIMSRFDDPKSKTYQTPTFFLMGRGVRGAKAGLTRGQWALQLDKIVCG